jgi:hypothetical protein
MVSKLNNESRRLESVVAQDDLLASTSLLPMHTPLMGDDMLFDDWTLPGE